jgi:alcohol dehydrogenase class IV
MDFEHFSVPRIIFGNGRFSEAGAVAARLGRKALIVTHGSESAAPLVRRLSEQLRSAGITVELQHIGGEPEVHDVDVGVDTARTSGAEVVIGLGGGSAIDAAKAIAGVLANGGSALDYMEVIGEGKKIERPAKPWIAIPVTAGTGAEVTRNAVIGFREKHFKASLRSDLLLPRAAIVDPELGVDVRPEVTARCGMDALTQCLEAFVSKRAQPLSDQAALDGLRRASRSLRRAYENGSDLESRGEMALAALCGGIALTNAGLGAVHGFAAPLGAQIPVPHGTVCAALLPHVMDANIKALRAKGAPAETLARYATIGRALSGLDVQDDDEAIDAGVKVARDLVRELGIPRLGSFGLRDKDVPGIVGRARKASSMRYNPVDLDEDVLVGILRAAI